LFFGLSGGFSLCACAQQGQLRWPARKRGTALLLQPAFAAFTAANGVSLLLSLTQREKILCSFPSLSIFCIQWFRSKQIITEHRMPFFEFSAK